VDERTTWPYGIPQTGHMGGKTAATKQAIREALAEREHVHVATASGTYCCGGDPECRLERVSPPSYGLP
jgi:hypothetical protein